MTQAAVRIAFPSEDGLKISRHFGKAPYFIIANLNPDGTYQTEMHRVAGVTWPTGVFPRSPACPSDEAERTACFVLAVSAVKRARTEGGALITAPFLIPDCFAHE